MCIGFTVNFSLNWENVVAVGRFPVLKVVNFFSQIFIITQMRLKFTSLSLLDNQRFLNSYPIVQISKASIISEICLCQIF